MMSRIIETSFTKGVLVHNARTGHHRYEIAGRTETLAYTEAKGHGDGVVFLGIRFFVISVDNEIVAEVLLPRCETNAATGYPNPQVSVHEAFAAWLKGEPIPQGVPDYAEFLNKVALQSLVYFSKQGNAELAELNTVRAVRCARMI
jgi:hypothetical protein